MAFWLFSQLTTMLGGPSKVLSRNSLAPQRLLVSAAFLFAVLFTAAGGTAIVAHSQTVFQGHTDALTSAVISPDGRRVLTGSEDKTARLWETDNGQLLATFQGHSDGVTSAAFSPDGTRVLTASRDKTARLWEADSG